MRLFRPSLFDCKARKARRFKSSRCEVSCGYFSNSRQTSFRLFTKPFPKLVALEQQPGIRGVRRERFLIRRPCLRRFFRNVEPADAEIAPDDGKRRIEYTTFPKPDRLGMPPPVVKQIAQVIRRAGIFRVGANGRLQKQKSPQAAMESEVVMSFRGCTVSKDQGAPFSSPSFSRNQPRV